MKEKKVLAYVIGVALGDGNLSNPNGRATRLRVTCDTKYPQLIKRIRGAIQTLLPKNKVSIVKRRKTYADISCYSNQWEKWLGWKVGKGTTYQQKVSVPQWIIKNKTFSKECLRGLLETDGCVYRDRGYLMINFTSIIHPLANDVYKMITGFGFRPTIYKIPTLHRNKYVVRIVRNSKNFLKTVEVAKY